MASDGARPFVDVRGYDDGARRQRLWRAAVGCYDDPAVVLAAPRARQVAADAELVLITQRQSQTQPPQLLVLLRSVLLLVRVPLSVLLLLLVWVPQ